VAVTNNPDGWSQGITDISQYQSANFISNQFGVET
jgi:hypothetical protein